MFVILFVSVFKDDDARCGIVVTDAGQDDCFCAERGEFGQKRIDLCLVINGFVFFARKKTRFGYVWQNDVGLRA